MAVTSACNAWAVGFYSRKSGAAETLIERWNGKAWKVQPSPNQGGPAHSNELLGVSATSATNAWAVGGHFLSGITYRNLALRWNGSSWCG